MVTDPIQRIREHVHAHELDLDTSHVLELLATLPPSPGIPYLTVSLDWRVEGTAPGRTPDEDPRPSERRARRDDDGVTWRPARHYLDRELETLIASYRPRGEAFESLSADAARIVAYLDNDLDPSAQGVFLVACAAKDVFVPLALGLPVPTQCAIGPIPGLTVLARLVDDNPTYAVLLADQHDATLSFVTQATFAQSVALDSTDYPRKQKQGGWSQRRFQARADERVAAFARGIADETQRALDELDVDMLILAGDEIIISALNAEFHPTVTERVIETLRLDIGTSAQDVIAATLPLARKAERQREVDATRQLCDNLGASGNAVAGPEATLTALQAGQVATLLLTDDFSAMGWADYTFPLAGVGEVPSAHPAGGQPTSIVPVVLEEELVRLALHTGAEVQIIKTAGHIRAADLDEIPEAGSVPPRSDPAVALDAMGGVGALLRFTMDTAETTSEG